MKKDNKEILKSFAVLYLYVAASDSEFLDVERLTMTEKLLEWNSDANQEEVEDIISEAIGFIKSKDELQTVILNSLKIIDEQLDEDNKIMLLKDLISIAISDGKLANEERNIIISLAENWNLPDNNNIDKYIQEVITSLAQQTPNDFLREAGFSDDEIESCITQDKKSSEWLIIHDVLTALIFIGSQAVNNLTDIEWKIIGTNVNELKFDKKNGNDDLPDYNDKEIKQLFDVVLDKMIGDQTDEKRSTEAYNESVVNIINYYNEGKLNKSDIYAIIKLMFAISMADDSITDMQKAILGHIIGNFIQSIPELEKI